MAIAILPRCAGPPAAASRRSRLQQLQLRLRERPPWIGTLALLAAIWPHVGAAVLFGQSAAFSGATRDLGLELRRGVEASFALANAEGGAGAFGNVSLAALDDGYDPARAASNAGALLASGALGFVAWSARPPPAPGTLPLDAAPAHPRPADASLGTLPAAAALAVASEAGAPFFGPVTGAAGVGREPFNALAVHLRPRYDDEGEAAIAFALDGLQAARVSVLYQADAFGEAVLEAARAALARRGLRPASAAPFPRNTDDVDGAVALLAADLPQVVLLGATYGAAARAVQVFSALSAPLPWFLALSVLEHRAFYSALAGYGLGAFDRAFVTSAVPSPLDPAAPAVARYAAALRAREGPAAAPSFLSFEAFLAGELLVQALRRVPAASAAAGPAGARGALLEAVYAPLGFEGSGLFRVGGLSIGPYSRSCPAGEPEPPAPGACRRNEGLSSVHVFRLRAAGAAVEAALAAPVPAFSLGGAAAGPLAERFLTVGLTADLRGPSSALSLPPFSASPRPARSRGRAPGGRRVYVVALDDGGEGPRAAANARRLVAEFGAVALLGATSDAAREAAAAVAAAAGVPLLAPHAGARDEPDEGTAEGAPPPRHVLHLRASADDEVWALLKHARSFAAAAGAPGPRPVALYSEEAFGRARRFAARLVARSQGWAEPLFHPVPPGASEADAAAAVLAASPAAGAPVLVLAAAPRPPPRRRRRRRRGRPRPRPLPAGEPAELAAALARSPRPSRTRGALAGRRGAVYAVGLFSLEGPPASAPSSCSRPAPAASPRCRPPPSPSPPAARCGRSCRRRAPRAPPGPEAGCQPCAPGTFAAGPGRACLPCPPGSFAEKAGSTGCVPCGGSAACALCRPGSAAASRGLPPASPAPGELPAPPRRHPLPRLPPQRVLARPGATGCERCPPNSVATGAAEASAALCACAAGFYSRGPLPLAAEGAACLPCPRGRGAPGPHRGHGRRLPRGERLRRVPLAAGPVPALRQLPGRGEGGGGGCGDGSGGNGSCAYAACAPEGCAPGYTGFLCGACAPGYFRAHHACLGACPHRQPTPPPLL
eukprot:tig00000403_g363.t1